MKLRIILFFVFFVTIWSLGQSSKNTSGIIQRVDSIFTAEFSLLQLKNSVLDSKSFVNQLSDLNLGKQTNDILSRLSQSKQRELRSNLGLSFSSSYLNNQGTTIFNLEDNLVMQARFQTGLEWDLLKGGIIENRTKAKEIAYQTKIDEFVLKSENDKYAYLNQFNTIIYLFNKQKLTILNRRIALLQGVTTNENELFHKRLLKKEDILETQQRYNQVQALKHIYEPYNQNLDSVFNTKLLSASVEPFDLNEELILKSIKVSASDDSLKYWVNALLDTKDKWYNQVQLGAYGRYNYYDMAGTSPDRGFYSLGVNASVPLFSGYHQRLKRKPLELESKLYTLQKERDFATEDLLNDIYEFRYKLHQFITFSYKKQVFEEQVRLEDVKRSLGSSYYSPLKAVKNIDDVLAIEMELIELKQNLYLKLLRIHEKRPDIPYDSLIKPLQMNQLMDQQLALNKSIYVWSSMFENQESSYIFQYLKYHHFEKALIAFQRNDAYLHKKISVMKLLKADQRQTALMIGNNNLLFETNIPKWFDGVVKDFKEVGIEEIHLDVEPQALKEWKDQKNILLEKYITMLTQIRKYTSDKGIKLSVSIPLYYPEETMNTIFELTDEVHFMCYENVKPDYLVRKLKGFDFYKDKISIALRTEDFKSRKEMEDFGLMMKELTGIEKVTFHDLKRLIALDNKELKR